MNDLYISGIYIYPIKSLGGVSLKEAIMEDRGLKYDRRWMLVDDEGTFITQRKHHQLALLKVEIQNETIIVSHKNDPGIKISFLISEVSATEIVVSIWDDFSIGVEVSKNVSEWFSDFMKMEVRLVKMPLTAKRKVDPNYAAQGEIVSFADGYPCLLIGQSSLDNLNQKLEDPINMNRFRPNFVFTGGEAHMEDRIKTFALNGIEFQCVKPCARCILITVDQETGMKSGEPLKTLASYRKEGNKIMFGQNLIHKGEGKINLGDQMMVSNWK
ncbi:oxidoreductase [Pedobacter sp. Leaf41]|uniref:MOSC domain-containing protein n=1 Tax=Pedobacter sp. Leaf41 TaxID=1736218 RepID=UPI00070304CD|nr:MOSC N-terminal beta barrel domain-containing protein [Pedobacter sp. Leaf41]KQN32317.1 oxidoreductase [Pedobacter sp. Leaf41]RZK68032.1 MAG: MOSC domain-containing protein [Pedobacter sp.]